MSNPNVLYGSYGEIMLQVRDFLLLDTDPQYGLLSALGAGANSVYPRADFGSDGPTKSRADTPTPFLVLYYNGKRATDDFGREHRIIIEIHDDRDHGIQRLPGLLRRLYVYLLGGRDAGGTKLPGFRATNDDLNRYVSGLIFKEESPRLPDERLVTNIIQVMLCIHGQDRTSGRGTQG